MGKYAITIHGTGPHENGRPEEDAEQLAADLVQHLQAHGHDLSVAQFDAQHPDGSPTGTSIDLLSFVDAGITEADDRPGDTQAPVSDAEGGAEG